MASNGWANLGSAVAGNGARQAQLYEQGATGVARLEGLLSEARRRRDEEAGFSGITPDTVAAANTGDPSAQATLVSAMFHAGRNPQELSGYNRQQLGTTIQQDAYDRVKAGAPIADVNPLLAVFQGKPVDLSNVKDGVVYNPMVTPDQSQLSATPVGLAEIMQRGAEADAAKARAASSYATAARTRSEIGSTVPGGSNPSPKPIKAPAGYRYRDDGSLEPIPGGPKDPANASARAPNNEQSNAAGFANRMVAAEKELDDLTSQGYDPSSWQDRTATAIGGVAGNTLMSGRGQQYQQAAQNWVRANLRKESGAAIGKDEMDQEVRNYFPVAGDTAETIAQKERNRAIVTQNMIRTAGPAWTQSPNAPAASPSPASSVSPGGSRSSGHAVGDIINVAGKQYRVTGGDPNDPDVEPL